MKESEIAEWLNDIRLDAQALSQEIGREDLMSSQKYYADQIVRKVQELLNQLAGER